MPSQDDPTATQTNFPTPTSGHAVALAVTLSLVGVLLLVGITFFTVRMRRARSEEEQQMREGVNVNNSPRRSTVLDPRHPASHITPFSSEHFLLCGISLWHLILMALQLINLGLTCVLLDDVWMEHGTSKTQKLRLNPMASQILPPSVLHYHSGQPPKAIWQNPMRGVTDEIRTAVMSVDWNLHPLLIIQSFIRMKVTVIERIDLGTWTIIVLLGFCLFCAYSYETVDQNYNVLPTYII
jgi:hypothetical protein